MTRSRENGTMPRLRNITRSTITVAGLAIPAGRVGEVEDEAHRQWLNRSGLNRSLIATAYRVEPAETDRLLSLMLDCKAMPDRYPMTAQGKPSCKALAVALERFVSAKERDRAWARANPENGVGAS